MSEGGDSLGTRGKGIHVHTYVVQVKHVKYFSGKVSLKLEYVVCMYTFQSWPWDCLWVESY